ncbi:MAG: hypothetical protein AB8B51_09745 [Sedimentitalea sp.]
MARAVGGRIPSPAPAETPVFAAQKPATDALSIPVQTETSDTIASRAAQLRGQFLARQDRWEDLSSEIKVADMERKTTPGGLPTSELLAFGARSDVVHAVEHALLEECAPEAAAMIDGINGLEAMRHEAADDPYLSLIVALTHIDIGWAWRGTQSESAVPKLNRAKCSAHFDRAAELLAPWCGIELNSPALAAARCALLAGQQEPHLRIADDYEDLIDLNPENPRHMRSLGYHLLPRWFGSLDQLELEARRTASRTLDLWGCGAYTWVYFDAIVTDNPACAQVDVEFFIEGLHDIVDRVPGQEMVNLLASFCAVAMRRWQGHSTAADLPRLQIVDCAEWLIRDHLTEIHPLIWAHAADGFDNNARVTSINRFAARGRDQALATIADLFRDDIQRGQHVTFTPDGPQLHPA